MGLRVGRGDQVCMVALAGVHGIAYRLATHQSTASIVVRSAKTGIEHSPAWELNPATPSTRLKAGPGVRRVEGSKRCSTSPFGRNLGRPSGHDRHDLGLPIH
jgi:hypothetical protein